MSHDESQSFLYNMGVMNTQVALILSAIVVSWVMFVFNFVLGYYMGRSVEAAEKARQEEIKNQKSKKNARQYAPSFPQKDF